MEKYLPTPKMIQEARDTGRGHSWILELLIFIPVFLIATQLEAIPAIVAMVIRAFSTGVVDAAREALQAGDVSAYTDAILSLNADTSGWMTLVSLFSTVIATLTALLFCRWIEKRRAPTLGFRRDGAVREYLVGILVALVMMSAAVGLALLTKAYSFRRASVSLLPMLLYLFGYMLQGMSEEVLCRGYLMVSIARRSPTWLAAVLSSLVFAALHLLNPGISLLAFVNLFLCGLVFAVYILKRGNIWGACAAHSFWNFFQGNLYGISVSGTGWGDGASPLAATADLGNKLWSGGVFGIEGGLCDTIVEVAALLILLFLVPAKASERAVPREETDL